MNTKSIKQKDYRLNKNFLNNQNYIINKKEFLSKYISNIDKEEEKKSNNIIFSMLLAFFLVFIIIALGLTYFREELINGTNIKYFSYSILSITILGIIIYIGYITKHLYFYERRNNKYNILKYSPKNNKIKFINKIK